MPPRPIKTIKMFLLIALLSIQAGCQTATSTPPSAEISPNRTVTESTRVNAYALLDQLLENEKDVSLLRFIKREHSDLKDLIKQIAKASGTDAKLLREFARHDPTILLSDFRLPLGEVKTRAAIAAFEQKQLLHESGRPFELTLLLTQVEAVNYGRFLALVAAQNETDLHRREALDEISQQMEKFYDQLVEMISIGKE